MDLQDAYVSTLQYVSLKHKGQNVPGTEFPYVVHITSVAMEVLVAATHTPDLDTQYAVTMALLHDTLEDTKVTYQDLHHLYGDRVAEGVLALTKFESLEKEDQIQDSLNRIKQLEKEVAVVKLADRIINLGAPAADWKKEKREHYKRDSEKILHDLAYANTYLAERLQAKLIDYQSYVETGFK